MTAVAASGSRQPARPSFAISFAVIERRLPLGASSAPASVSAFASSRGSAIACEPSGSNRSRMRER